MGKLPYNWRITHNIDKIKDKTKEIVYHSPGYHGSDKGICSYCDKDVGFEQNQKCPVGTRKEHSGLREALSGGRKLKDVLAKLPKKDQRDVMKFLGFMEFDHL